MHNVRIRGNGNRRIPLDTAMDLRGLLYFIIGIPVPIISGLFPMPMVESKFKFAISTRPSLEIPRTTSFDWHYPSPQQRAF
jgi:hypothetical protein